MKTKIGNVQLYDIYEGVLFQRGKLHNFTYEEKKEFISLSGVSVIFGLAGNMDEDLATIPELKYYQYYSIPDNKLSEHDAKALNKIAKKLASYILNGEIVLVHCNAGRNRSGLLNAMIIVNLIECTGSEAIEIVRNERPNALANDNFVLFLENYVR